MKKTTTLSLLLLTSLVILAACGGKAKTSIENVPDKLVGSWVAPVNGMPNMEEGMKLDEGGVASSINMATLVYESWEAKSLNEHDNSTSLILKGKSIGNGMTFDFTDTLKVDKLTADSLVVTNGDYTRAYHRQK